MTKFGRPRFYLGTEIAGSVYIFTALGSFRSVESARTKAHSAARNGDVFVYSQCDVSLRGVVYGCTPFTYEATVVRAGRPVAAAEAA